MSYTRIIIVLGAILLNGCEADESMSSTAVEVTGAPEELSINKASDDIFSNEQLVVGLTDWIANAMTRRRSHVA